MIDQLTKKQLKAQLKANSITIPVGADEAALRELLSKAIEEEKAELKELEGVDLSKGKDGEENEDSEEDENEQAQAQAEEQAEEQVIEGVTGEQASIVQCMRYMQGLPFRAE